MSDQETQIENLDIVVEKVLNSVELSLESADVSPETQEEVLETVRDSVGNHSEEFLPYITSEAVTE